MAGSSSMAVTTIQKNILSLAKSLSEDKDIKNNINALLDSVESRFKELINLMKKSCEDVAKQVQLLVHMSSTQDVNVEQMVTCVNGMRINVEESMKDFKNIETKTVELLITCGQRLTLKEKKGETSQRELVPMEKQLGDLESQQKSKENEIGELDNAALEFSNRAEAQRSKQDFNTFIGYTGALIATAGLLAAPLTGGLSLTATLVGGIGAGVNFNDAADCRGAAERAQFSANQKRTESSKVADDVKTLKTQIETKKKSIEDINRQIKTLQDDANALKAIITATNGFTCILQEIDQTMMSITTQMYDAGIKSKSFELEQMAIAHTNYNDTSTDVTFNNFLAEWNSLQEKLKQHSEKLCRQK